MTARSRPGSDFVAPTLDGIVSCAELMRLPLEPLSVLGAYLDARGRLRAWCPHCERCHSHSNVPGPHPPHCRWHASPYWPGGYRLRVMGPGDGR